MSLNILIPVWNLLSGRLVFMHGYVATGETFFFILLTLCKESYQNATIVCWHDQTKENLQPKPVETTSASSKVEREISNLQNVWLYKCRKRLDLQTPLHCLLNKSVCKNNICINCLWRCKRLFFSHPIRLANVLWY